MKQQVTRDEAMKLIGKNIVAIKKTALGLRESC